MENDVRLALLGDKAAQERLTERGEMIPCPCCKSRATVVKDTYQAPGRYSVTCGGCFLATPWSVCKEDAIERWNTRSPILTPKELEKLEGLK